MDFLKPSGANVDLESCRLRLQNMNLTLRYSTKQIAVGRVILQENTVVPTNHKVVFLARIDLGANPRDYEDFIEPNTIFT